MAAAADHAPAAQAAQAVMLTLRKVPAAHGAHATLPPFPGNSTTRAYPPGTSTHTAGPTAICWIRGHGAHCELLVAKRVSRCTSPLWHATHSRVPVVASLASYAP